MATKKKSTNPVGRPRNTHGKETLLNGKKSFKVDKNTVFDKWIDPLIIMVIILIIACVCIWFVK